MAILKVVNSSKMNHGALRNVLEYVTREMKVRDGYYEINGPYDGTTLNYDTLYQNWINEKKDWGKDSGRMYVHNILSFHKDEDITPKQVLEIAREYTDKYYHGHQYVITIHQDRDHLHAHIVANTVSFIDGKKLHQTKHDLERQKEYTNDLCRERGFSVAEKGKHFDGTKIEQGEIIAWSKDKYNLLLNDSKNSFIAECGIAILDVIPQSTSRDEFISGMEKRGWSVQWEDNKKHIVFQDKDGNKVRDTRLEKTFSGLPSTKEALTHEFERQNELKLAHIRDERDCAEYYKEVESTLAGADDALEGSRINRGFDECEQDNRYEGPEDFRAFISEYRAKEDDGRKSIETSIRDAEDAERASINREAERRLAELIRDTNKKRDRELEKEKSRSRGFSR